MRNHSRTARCGSGTYINPSEHSVTVADFVLAYTLDWANEWKVLDRCPQLVAYMERMYARPKAPKRIAALRRRGGLNRALHYKGTSTGGGVRSENCPFQYG